MAVSASDVQNIMDTDLTTSQIDTFLTTAERILVDNLDGKGVATATRDEIKKYLAAHIIRAVREKGVQSQSIGPENVDYVGDTAMDLRATMYGQQVLMLDPTGSLGQLGKAEGEVLFQAIDPDPE